MISDDAPRRILGGQARQRSRCRHPAVTPKRVECVLAAHVRDLGAALSGLQTSIVTFDVGMSFQAKAAGLDVKWFERPDPPRKPSRSSRTGNRSSLQRGT
jgi:hypothetical protein